MRWTTDKIRQSFLDFFRDRGHAIVPSAPLVPKGDPTLLFTNAGMVQFKDYFLGLRTPPERRVVDCQKCLRISGKHNDLEAVGRDTYHHTFFEMLGNWSFGDYYKREAIAWHWELITDRWGIDPKRLWATIYTDDDEAEAAWKEIKNLPRGRILRFEKDNFWEMGETGPCGPCSEIHIDRGAAACDGKAHKDRECGVNVDGCERFIELANLVFIQYDRDAAGKLTPLPMKCVDTGTGLERVAAVLQGAEAGRVLSNYDIDVFQTIITAIEETATRLGNKARYGRDPETDVSFRAIADHARSVSFLLAEGIRPGNAERPYVLRRLIRRAARRGRYLQIGKPFLQDVCEAVINCMGNAYPELRERSDDILDEAYREEERFEVTIDRGLELIVEELSLLHESGQHIVPGEFAFELYDTYGFPLDLTQDVFKDEGYKVDVEGFDRLMDEQRERGRAAQADKLHEMQDLLETTGTSTDRASIFVGYGRYDWESAVIHFHARTGGLGGQIEVLRIVVSETPFYPEGGGQVGDRGVIEAETGGLFEVIDTRKANGLIVHIGRLLRGDGREFMLGKRVHLKVDRIRRDAAMLNHSATHILHYALRDILGSGVHQAGSLVTPDRLRFDFNHNGAIADGDLETIEQEINARIREDAPVTTDEMAYDDAIRAGALAFFGDKYGDRVRVVRMGDFSVELCGGTHVDRTGQIGLFKLEAESGVAAGVRRVEALTGSGALEAIRRREKMLEEIGHHLGARDEQALARLKRLVEREKELEKNLRAMESRLAAGAGGGGNEQVRTAGGIKVVTRVVENINPRALGEMADRIRDKHGSCVVAVGSRLGDKVALVVGVTSDLTPKIKAGDIIRQIAPIVGGSGGGRPDFAQAGGKDPAKLDQALERVASLVGK
jgi:alanyl-tRNA synthetase